MARGYHYELEQLTEMQNEAFTYYRAIGYSNLEAYDRATEAVERYTGYGISHSRMRADREEARRADHAEEILARSTPFGHPKRASPSRYDRYDESESRRRIKKSSRQYEEYDEHEREAPRRSTKQSSSQPNSKTEYDRMFQNGGDKYASRTSGKVLDPEEIEALAEKLYYDICEQGKDPEYARQKSEQLYIRELGKYNAKMTEAGYVMEDDGEYAKEDTYAARDKRRGARRTRSARKEYEDDDFDGSSSYGSQAKETYNTSYPYSNEDLKLMRKQIYQDWCDKGVNPREAKREAQKWYNAKMKAPGGGSSSRGSGFDSFGDIRDALDDDDDCPRKSRPSHGTRSGKSDQSKGYRTVERRPGDKSRGYHTEERRPGGGYSSSDYDDSDEPDGVKPDVDLYMLIGVSKFATMDEIKKAHKKLCMKYHPDRVAGGSVDKKAATDKMSKINQAYDVLKDYKMRAYYDRTGLMASMRESPDA